MTSLEDVMNARARSVEFVRLLTASSGPVYGFILSLLPRFADAEEVFQEVCRIAWERFDEFKPGTDFTAWACRLAHFRVLEFRRRQQHVPTLFSDLLDAKFVESSIEHEPLGERHAALLDCLQKLAPRDRELIARRYSADVKPAAIAQEKGLTVSAIHKSLNRVHQLLFNCIQRNLQKEGRS
jgi:RNA polymerase sigma-70 factor (ECF subfamily)